MRFRKILTLGSDNDEIVVIETEDNLSKLRIWAKGCVIKTIPFSEPILSCDAQLSPLKDSVLILVASSYESITFYCISLLYLQLVNTLDTLKSCQFECLETSLMNPLHSIILPPSGPSTSLTVRLFDSFTALITRDTSSYIIINIFEDPKIVPIQWSKGFGSIASACLYSYPGSSSPRASDDWTYLTEMLFHPRQLWFHQHHLIIVGTSTGYLLWISVPSSTEAAALSLAPCIIDKYLSEIRSLTLATVTTPHLCVSLATGDMILLGAKFNRESQSYYDFSLLQPRFFSPNRSDHSLAPFRDCLLYLNDVGSLVAARILDELVTDIPLMDPSSPCIHRFFVLHDRALILHLLDTSDVEMTVDDSDPDTISCLRRSLGWSVKEEMNDDRQTKRLESLISDIRSTSEEIQRQRDVIIRAEEELLRLGSLASLLLEDQSSLLSCTYTCPSLPSEAPQLLITLTTQERRVARALEGRSVLVTSSSSSSSSSFNLTFSSPRGASVFQCSVEVPLRVRELGPLVVEGLLMLSFDDEFHRGQGDTRVSRLFRLQLTVVDSLILQTGSRRHLHKLARESLNSLLGTSSSSSSLSIRVSGSRATVEKINECLGASSRPLFMTSPESWQVVEWSEDEFVTSSSPLLLASIHLHHSTQASATPSSLSSWSEADVMNLARPLQGAWTEATRLHDRISTLFLLAGDGPSLEEMIAVEDEVSSTDSAIDLLVDLREIRGIFQRLWVIYAIIRNNNHDFN